MSKRYQAAILTASYNGLKVPNAPTIGTATASGLSASVTFTAPSNIGGGAITGYTVVSSPGGITGTGASSPVTVSGLTSGTSYTFTVVANNAYGSGPASAASNSITAVDPSAFIENLFSTWLYTGNGSTQTITNGIDLSTYGGLVWSKARSSALSNFLCDTVRGRAYYLYSDATVAQQGPSAAGNDITSFNSNGYSLGPNANADINNNAVTFASWTFREQPKFFDIVTYTGNGATSRTISHNLGAVPGCIIIKRTNTTSNWAVYHRSLGSTDSTPNLLFLNTTDGALSSTVWDNTAPTTTTFNVDDSSTVNASGSTYVAYLFAHDAGGFGASGSDNVISCGSYTGSNSSAVTVNLGYEPQWVMIKRIEASGSPAWWIGDTMRGFNLQGIKRLEAWTSDAEANTYNGINPTSTGFVLPYGTVLNDAATSSYIYVAIRRGPMAVPTDPTKVFLPTSRTGNASLTTVTSGFAPDVVFARREDTLDNGNESVFADKLRGTGTLSTNNAGTEYAGGATSGLNAYLNTGVTLGINNSPIYAFNYSGLPYALYQFQRAPGFMDEVCYTGTNGVQTVPHNLTVAPELMLIKNRTGGNNWAVYSADLGITKYLTLNEPDAATTFAPFWGGTTPTSTNFYLGGYAATNNGGDNYVAYLFATCAGVSKVGSYTGTGTLTTINCGFTGGARFVLIKPTSTTGNWLLWDTARGMVSGTDPTMAINTTAPEYNSNSVYTVATGFQLLASPAEAINTNGVTYIYLAIA